MRKRNLVKLGFIVSAGLIFSACGGGSSDASKEILLMKDFRKMYPTWEDYEKVEAEWKEKCKNSFSKRKENIEGFILYSSCEQLKRYVSKFKH